MRLFLAMVVVTLVATAGFALAIHEFVEVLEEEMVHRTMAREMDDVVLDYQNHVPVADTSRGSSRVFVTSDSQPISDLPVPLQAFARSSKKRTELRLHGTRYSVARRQIGASSIFLLFDINPVEKLEARLVTVGWVTLLGVLLVAVLVSIGAAYLILRPVRRLARRLADIVPQHGTPSIASDYRDRDMQEIAASFDDLIARFRDFVERERAFTADAGHELRTPLAVALSTHELMLTLDELAPRARERALRSQAACQRMSRTVTALLFIARDEQSVPWRANPHELARDLNSEYAGLLETHGNRLSLDIVDADLAAPPDALHALLHNLVGHAASHTEYGEIQLRIDTQHICIRYGSEGHLPTRLDDAFKRDYQPEHGGRFGLGLYLVGRLCERLAWPVHGETDAQGCASIHIACKPAEAD